jgi:D-sedoheptulose 7-phosphate isomerase
MENRDIRRWLDEFVNAIDSLKTLRIGNMIRELARIREDEGRVFVLGVGGGAAAAGHVVQDLRKICGIEAYSPTDSIGEVTARTNDDGWDTTFVEYLKTSKITAKDGLLILSCSGGKSTVSQNIAKALGYAFQHGVYPMAIVGDEEGIAAQLSPFPIVVYWPSKEYRTPFTEAMWSVVMHLIVNSEELTS